MHCMAQNQKLKGERGKIYPRKKHQASDIRKFTVKISNTFALLYRINILIALIQSPNYERRMATLAEFSMTFSYERIFLTMPKENYAK